MRQHALIATWTARLGRAVSEPTIVMNVACCLAAIHRAAFARSAAAKTTIAQATACAQIATVASVWCSASSTLTATFWALAGIAKNSMAKML